MPTVSLYASLEGAQHGDKTLLQFVQFAKAAGCKGCQPSIYHLIQPDGTLMPASEIRATFDGEEMLLDGISSHCQAYVLLTAEFGSKGYWPFIPPNLRTAGAAAQEEWAETLLLRLVERSAELNLGVMPLFWGVLNFETSSGYPWGFFKGDGYDLVQEGLERFVAKTKRVRDAARSANVILAHEIHPGTAAQCGEDFLMLVDACDGDPALGVHFDPSHAWQNQSFEAMMRLVGPRIAGCHVKDHRVIEGRSVRSMESDWQKRGMQFTELGQGQLDLVRYVEVLIEVGYPQRYAARHGRDSAPLISEAESAYRSVNATSTASCQYIAANLCREIATGSFEDAMGSKE